MSHETSFPDVPLVSETHGDPGEPMPGADPEILDEDPLLEEQPYAVLEEPDEDFPLAGLDSLSGGGSW